MNITANNTRIQYTRNVYPINNEKQKCSEKEVPPPVPSVNLSRQNVSFCSIEAPLFKLSKKGNGIIIPVKTGKESETEVFADKCVIQTYFTDKTGNLDRCKIKTFKEVFTDVYKKETAKHAAFTIMLGNSSNWSAPEDNEPSEEDIIFADAQDIISDLKQQKEDADISRGSLLEEMRKPQDEYQFVLALLKKMPEGSFKQKFMSELLKSEVSLPKDVITKNACIKTLTFLSLSRKGDDYDITDTKEKQDLISRIIFSERNRNESFLGEKLAQGSIKHKGDVDFKYISSVCEILNNSCDTSVESEEIISMISDIAKKDEENEPGIMSFLKNFSKAVSPSDENFKEFSLLCFNPVAGKFDKHSAELVPLIYSYTDTLTNKKLDEASKEEWLGVFIKSEKFKLETAQSYFESIRDEKTGEIKTGAKSVEDFCKGIEF